MLEKALPSPQPVRALISPRHLLYILLALYALMESFPVSYSLNTFAFFGIWALSAFWLFAFPTTRLITRANYEMLLFFALWLGYSALSYIWAIDKEQALEAIFLVFRYACIFLFFDALFRQPALLKAFYLFLVAVLALYIGTALWEMLSFQHLPSSRYYGMKLYWMPTGPFYNQNNLAAFMLFILPVTLYLPRLYPVPGSKYYVGIISALFFGIITLQGARIAMLAVAPLLAWVIVISSSRRSKLILALILLIAIWSFMHFAQPLVRYGWKMLSKELDSFGTEVDSAHMSSLKIRKQLIFETVDFLEESHFMGLGGGNYEHYMDTDRQYRTAGITNAHNWFLELAGNYGIFILLSFCYIYFRWLWLLYLRYKDAHSKERYWYLAWMWVLILFIPVAALPSSIRWNSHIWIIFAAINAAGNSTFTLHTKKQRTINGTV